MLAQVWFFDPRFRTQSLLRAHVIKRSRYKRSSTELVSCRRSGKIEFRTLSCMPTQNCRKPTTTLVL